MELMKINNTQYTVYEELLLERDQLHKEAGSIWVDYVNTFGQLTTEVFEEKVECIKRKKMIEYCQRVRNHSGVVDMKKLQEYLAWEMAAYNAHLDRLRRERDECGEAGTSSPYEVQRAKILYRRLAKLLHPDTHPGTRTNETLAELWQRAVEAYGRNDVKALTEIEVLTRRALKDSPNDIVELPDLDEKIADLKDEIAMIITTEPYLYKDLLENEEKTAAKLKELQEELEAYRQYHKQLDDVIEELLQNGGIEIQWDMT